MSVSLSGDGHILAVGADKDFRVFGVLVQDSDEDEVADSNDAFPNDPAASLDTDGDTLPDDWNAGATAEQIADSSLTVDDDDDNDGLTDLQEVALGLNPLNTDTDGDGIDDSSDENHVLISGAFPTYEFTVIRPGVEMVDSWLRLKSPNSCYIAPAAETIEGNRATYSHTFTGRTPSGTYIIGDDSPYVSTASGTLYDQSTYPFELINSEGVQSNAIIEDWSFTDASTDAGGAFTLLSDSLRCY